MYIWLIITILLILLFYVRHESMDASPYDMAQEQSGKIQQLSDKLSKITFSEISISVLEDENNTTSDQITQLRLNMPSDEASKQYPTK
jgi:hypothetical protein